jgi:hypothetical protein
MLPRTYRLAFLLLAVAVTGAIAAPAPEASPVIRYKFKAGDKLHYTLVQKMEMTMTVNGMDISTKVNQTADMTWQIVSVDKEGNGRMKQKINRIRYTLDLPGGKEELDTDDLKADGAIGKMLGAFFKAAVSEPFEVTLAPTGAVKSVKVPESIVKAAKGLPGLAEMFSEEGMKTMLSQGGFVLPKQAPVKGKSWKNKMELKTPAGKMIMTVTQTYKGQMKRDGKTLEEFSLVPVSTLEANGDNPTKITRQESKGTAYFDKAAGRLVETFLTSNMEMEIGTGNDALVQKTQQLVTMKLKSGK